LKKIDSQAVLEEARKTGISPYTLMKRKMNYRDGDIVKRCNRCVNSAKIVVYSGCLERCREIGISEKQEAEIKFNKTCDYFKSK
jgi:hypothetical protein